MSKLVWDAIGEHLYETGVRNGVLYPISIDSTTHEASYPVGVAWNGLTTVTEKPTGAEATAIYADDIKYLNLYSVEEFEATIEAYTYPDEFAECDGSAALTTGVMLSQQPRKAFGLVYRTVIGNDVDADDYGYKLHVIYHAMASPTEKGYSTINDSPEAITFSWDIKTTPVAVTGHKPTAHLVIDSTKVTSAKLEALEAVMFGADAFSASKTYAVGDIVEYTDGNTTAVYKCKTAITTAASWDATKWDVIAAAGSGGGPRLPLPDEIKKILTA